MQTAVATTAPKKDGVLEFVPYGAKDPIKLSLAIIKQYVAVKTRSGKTCDDSQAMKFMMLCQAQRLNPFVGDAFLVGYDKREKDGSDTPTCSLITAHQAFLKRAEENPNYEGMESGIIIFDTESKTITEREGDFRLPHENVVGGWAKVYRRGRKPTYRRLAIAAMKPAYDTPFWNDDKAPGQIVKCSEADALRATFPTLLGGMYMDHEMQSAAIDVSTVAPSNLVQIAENTENEKPEPYVEGQAKGEPASTVKEVNTPQSELEALIIKAGFTFDQFQTWGVDTGNVPNARELPDFHALDSKTAARLLKAPKGLLTQLAAAKGTVEA